MKKMTQVINKKLMKCCDCCKSHFDKPCAWLSLGNEYCTEIMETQKVIDQLTNNWNELEEWLKDMKTPKQDNWGDYGYTWALKIDVILDKMKEIKENNNVSSRD